MSEPGKSDRWNSLLETLGVPVSEKPEAPAEAPAEAPPAAAPKQQAVSMLPPQKAKAAPKPKSGPPAAKSPSYWSRIAGALGLETPAAPEPPTLDTVVQRSEEPRAEVHDEPHREPPSRSFGATGEEAELPPRSFERRERSPRQERSPRHERRPREERKPREERGRHDEPPTFGEPERREPLDQMFGPKSADVDVFSIGGQIESPRVREPSAKDGLEDDDNGSVIDYDLPEGSGSDLAMGEGASRAPSAEESGLEREGRRRRRRRGRGRGRRGTAEGRETAPPPREADIEPAGEEADFDLDRDEELDLESEAGAEMPPREERRPWGVREEEAERYPPSGERSSRERDGERGGRGRGRRGRGQDRGPAGEQRRAGYGGYESQANRPPRDEPTAAEDQLDQELDDLGDEGDEERGGDVPTHRKIPTWDEAVGILIDANMANRGPERDRDRDRGYGRGRGRR